MRDVEGKAIEILWERSKLVRRMWREGGGGAIVVQCLVFVNGAGTPEGVPPLVARPWKAAMRTPNLESDDLDSERD